MRAEPAALGTRAEPTAGQPARSAEPTRKEPAARLDCLWLDGDIDGGTWLKFLGIYTMSLVVPHGLAFKHRKEGWDAAAEMH